MEQTERLTLIHMLALAIQVMSASQLRVISCAERINSFAEMIQLLAHKPDNFIEANIETFNKAREEAQQVIEEGKRKKI